MSIYAPLYSHKVWQDTTYQPYDNSTTLSTFWMYTLIPRPITSHGGHFPLLTIVVGGGESLEKPNDRARDTRAIEPAQGFKSPLACGVLLKAPLGHSRISMPPPLVFLEGGRSPKSRDRIIGWLPKEPVV